MVRRMRQTSFIKLLGNEKQPNNFTRWKGFLDSAIVVGTAWLTASFVGWVEE